ncbi:sec-independent protein translocase protein TatC [Syntrophus gentianae]|uniref:Sec-independent protein translocase protein TatC n=1 Tax=Syntrophus gentianae TaxID=43775 RepID=A0A1H7Y7T4_9BACT|nr:twin-arginine translocase subunit TatC [Syntrophus gentianae]SEM41249.1 sec-independent protein translocase protein TatC [Syntrophus gentianae]
MTISTDEKLPLTTHLEELRKRLVRVLIALAIGFSLCYGFKEQLFQIVTYPLLEVLPKNSFMVFTSLPEAFFTYMKISFFASLLLTSPYILLEIWKFISPGLYPKEKKYVFPFVFFSTILFAGGVLFGYFVALPPAFKFFVSFSSDFLKPMVSMREYLALALKLLLAFGLCFELPVFVFFLTKIGVVNARMLSSQRRYAILIIFIAAAVLTPSPDIVSQLLMAVPLMVLYEISIVVARFAVRKPRENKKPVDAEKSKELEVSDQEAPGEQDV